ncbi:cytochrome P450 [Pseudophaeobacter profundi]|uniref:cytochrome P450 n=1 Tax=Pseudophaeobacter profundi TaxID=3034152 RepID=UPI00242F4A65|nr:cytochrome P450 [Pseudophaeobacter profundi]
MTIWTPQDDGYADLSSHDSFAHGAPHNTFARLRRHDPIHWTQYPGGENFWSVTRYEDITRMNKNTEVFSSARGIRMEDQSYEEYLARRTFQETDPPEHSQVRMKLMKAFSKTSMAQYEQEIRDICAEILDPVLELGEFDATKQIARTLPMRMLGRVVGLPETDLPWLVEKGDALIANTDPDFTAHVMDKLETDAFRLMPFNSPAGAELYLYAKQLMADKAKAGDTAGVLNMILQPAKDGSVISETEFRNFFCLLVAAGNDTTRYSIAAGIQALCHQPELLAQMQAGGAIWDTAADEIIRWATPAIYFRRTATRDIKVHDKLIREGDKVLYWFASANRDDSYFDDPFRVNLMRSPNRHLSFGQFGPHVCLGMWLARLEVTVLFQELAKRISHIEAAGPHKFLRSNFVGGIKELPVRVTRCSRRIYQDG